MTFDQLGQILQMNVYQVYAADGQDGMDTEEEHDDSLSKVDDSEVSLNEDGDAVSSSDKEETGGIDTSNATIVEENPTEAFGGYQKVEIIPSAELQRELKALTRGLTLTNILLIVILVYNIIRIFFENLLSSRRHCLEDKKKSETDDLGEDTDGKVKEDDEIKKNLPGETCESGKASVGVNNGYHDSNNQISKDSSIGHKQQVTENSRKNQLPRSENNKHIPVSGSSPVIGYLYVKDYDGNVGTAALSSASSDRDGFFQLLSNSTVVPIERLMGKPNTPAYLKKKCAIDQLFEIIDDYGGKIVLDSSKEVKITLKSVRENATVTKWGENTWKLARKGKLVAYTQR